ncbi:helix-turn-helix domain-containing protein [Clostridium sp. Marseille-P299]|uniref:helix-turn-helix domain-containing protein n=1 Tax=Clostridium sp. Marseille-P299 TaxID=1805477 RepID=UPI0009EEC0A4|nr:helix-turn-helix transcriptional regulator [Clostridium sp. Marseille-P299]
MYISKLIWRCIFIKIGKTIYTLRKEKQMTQEQLASLIGVSAPAVSKWENDSTYPDITLLSPLARALGTTVDTLLSFQQELNESELEQLTSSLKEYFIKNGFRAGIKKCKEYLEEYPNSEKLKFEIVMMTSMNLVYTLDSDYTDEEYENVQDYNETMCEQLINSSDINIKMTATVMLASTYMKKKKFDGAKILLETLPNNGISSEQLFPVLYIHKGEYETAAKLSQQYLLSEIQQVLAAIMNLWNISSRLNQYEKALLYAKEYYDLEHKFSFYNGNGAYLLVRSYLYLKDKNQALIWFECYINDILMAANNQKESIYWDYIINDDVSVSEKKEELQKIVLKSIDIDPNYDDLRNEYKFIEQVDRLKKSVERINE